MNKKVIGIILLIIIIGVSIGTFIALQNRKKGDDKMNRNSVVLYFSATGVTEKVANYISEITSSEIIEIIPAEEYTNDELDYNNDNSRANKEQNDTTIRPEIKNELTIKQYDVIYLGYPIWWGDVPKIILTAIENNDFSGKTIIPFCTSGGSDISTSINTLKQYHNNILTGKTFSSHTNKSEVESWINKLTD